MINTSNFSLGLIMKSGVFDSDGLNEILEHELAIGNEISEMSAWPKSCQRLIVLEYRFKKLHDKRDLNYRLVDDPHYWYAQYSTENEKECLACKFNVLI